MTLLHQDLEDFTAAAPAVYAAMRALTKAVDDSGLDKCLTELIKVRASQINGCAFCLQFHLSAARRLSIGAHKLDLVATWREAGIFSAREMAALAWTELLTALREPPSEADQAALLAQFSASEATFLTVAIGTINQWNRIAVALHFTPQVPASMTAARGADAGTAAASPAA